MSKKIFISLIIFIFSFLSIVKSEEDKSSFYLLKPDSPLEYTQTSQNETEISIIYTDISSLKENSIISFSGFYTQPGVASFYFLEIPKIEVSQKEELENFINENRQNFKKVEPQKFYHKDDRYFFASYLKKDSEIKTIALKNIDEKDDQKEKNFTYTVSIIERDEEIVESKTIIKDANKNNFGWYCLNLEKIKEKYGEKEQMILLYSNEREAVDVITNKKGNVDISYQDESEVRYISRSFYVFEEFYESENGFCIELVNLVENNLNKNKTNYYLEFKFIEKTPENTKKYLFLVDNLPSNEKPSEKNILFDTLENEEEEMFLLCSRNYLMNPFVYLDKWYGNFVMEVIDTDNIFTTENTSIDEILSLGSKFSKDSAIVPVSSLSTRTFIFHYKRKENINGYGFFHLFNGGVEDQKKIYDQEGQHSYIVLNPEESINITLSGKFDYEFRMEGNFIDIDYQEEEYSLKVENDQGSIFVINPNDNKFQLSLLNAEIEYTLTNQGTKGFVVIIKIGANDAIVAKNRLEEKEINPNEFYIFPLPMVYENYMKEINYLTKFTYDILEKTSDTIETRFYFYPAYGNPKYAGRSENLYEDLTDLTTFENFRIFNYSEIYSGVKRIDYDEVFYYLIYLKTEQPKENIKLTASYELIYHEDFNDYENQFFILFESDQEHYSIIPSKTEDKNFDKILIEVWKDSKKEDKFEIRSNNEAKKEIIISTENHQYQIADFSPENGIENSLFFNGRNSILFRYLLFNSQDSEYIDYEYKPLENKIISAEIREINYLYYLNVDFSPLEENGVANYEIIVTPPDSAMTDEELKNYYYINRDVIGQENTNILSYDKIEGIESKNGRFVTGDDNRFLIKFRGLMKGEYRVIVFATQVNKFGLAEVYDIGTVTFDKDIMLVDLTTSDIYQNTKCYSYEEKDILAFTISNNGANEGKLLLQWQGDLEEFDRKEQYIKVVDLEGENDIIYDSENDDSLTDYSYTLDFSKIFSLNIYLLYMTAKDNTHKKMCLTYMDNNGLVIDTSTLNPSFVNLYLISSTSLSYYLPEYKEEYSYDFYRFNKETENLSIENVEINYFGTDGRIISSNKIDSPIARGDFNFFGIFEKESKSLVKAEMNVKLAKQPKITEFGENFIFQRIDAKKLNKEERPELKRDYIKKIPQVFYLDLTNFLEENYYIALYSLLYETNIVNAFAGNYFLKSQGGIKITEQFEVIDKNYEFISEDNKILVIFALNENEEEIPEEFNHLFRFGYYNDEKYVLNKNITKDEFLPLITEFNFNQSDYKKITYINYYNDFEIENSHYIVEPEYLNHKLRIKYSQDFLENPNYELKKVKKYYNTNTLYEIVQVEIGESFPVEGRVNFYPLYPESIELKNSKMVLFLEKDKSYQYKFSQEDLINSAFYYRIKIKKYYEDSTDIIINYNNQESTISPKKNFEIRIKHEKGDNHEIKITSNGKVYLEIFKEYIKDDKDKDKEIIMKDSYTKEGGEIDPSMPTIFTYSMNMSHSDNLYILFNNEDKSQIQFSYYKGYGVYPYIYLPSDENLDSYITQEEEFNISLFNPYEVENEINLNENNNDNGKVIDNEDLVFIYVKILKLTPAHEDEEKKIIKYELNYEKTFYNNQYGIEIKNDFYGLAHYNLEKLEGKKYINIQIDPCIDVTKNKYIIYYSFNYENFLNTTEENIRMFYEVDSPKLFNIKNNENMTVRIKMIDGNNFNMTFNQTKKKFTYYKSEDETQLIVSFVKLFTEPYNAETKYYLILTKDKAMDSNNYCQIVDFYNAKKNYFKTEPSKDGKFYVDIQEDWIGKDFYANIYAKVNYKGYEIFDGVYYYQKIHFYRVSPTFLIVIMVILTLVVIGLGVLAVIYRRNKRKEITSEKIDFEFKGESPLIAGGENQELK